MRILLVLCSVLFFSGCTLRADFSPQKNDLNDALVGKPYYAQINIFGGNVATLTNVHGDREFVGTITPSDAGLYIIHCSNDKYDNNCVQVRGIPKRKGMIRVRVSGFFNVAMFQKSSEFDKTYTITVKDSEGSS